MTVTYMWLISFPRKTTGKRRVRARKLINHPLREITKAIKYKRVKTMKYMVGGEKMICPKCGTRYAPYPEGDYAFEFGIITPIKKDSEKRRKVEFDKDDEELCLTCEIIDDW